MEKGAGLDHPFAGEKLSPVSGVQVVKDLDEAIALIQDILNYQGKEFDVVLFGDSITDFWNNPNLALDGNPNNYATSFNMASAVSASRTSFGVSGTARSMATPRSTSR